ncbi:RNA 2',3'-cyclic phosphodiesterase [Halomonas saccharevitans]|uniref:RNA 2',3'-cyclic phosphodiesterase n=1 Tax=Halomonas saccharevitans TaxID=416872 RepID=A0ABU3NDP0_9GAMM|nr:RNA 2',3'-cyclic phosphodiesterase [Halomonas saccharevitans]MDT8879137.1 RNA 2',3'-cyclic phosphodiesterase [Halomonas saccharevitans]
MRLFLALMPPPALRRRLGELAERAHARCGGRRVPDDSLHLTLAFLGEVSEERAEELSTWVEGLDVPEGKWRLDAWGAFRRPGILWVGSQMPDRALVNLQASLWRDLEPQGFTGRPSRFIPHVTLLRRARRLETAGLSPPDLAWPYRRVALLRSFTDQDGARYQTLARSPLS